MSAIFENILGAVGFTPLVKLSRISSGNAQILGKMESFNPCGSVKDRIALAMIKDAEERGDINKDTLVVEPTSGNTGIGLAFVCASKGYKLALAMPESMSIERRKILKMLGAELILTPAAEGMAGAVKKAEQLVGESDNAYMPQQFKNPSNPRIHRETTAKEIWQDTDHKVDIFVAGIGTGGTITGVGETLKDYNPDVQVVAVEPEDSAVLSGCEAGPHKIQGIGAGFVPDVLNTKIYDEILQVSNKDAIEMARRLAREEAILCGISAGANVWAAAELAKRPENEGKTIVTIICDTGERYLSTELFEGLE